MIKKNNPSKLLNNIKEQNHTKKILIVDDDEGILDAISLILEDEGYIISSTTNGKETFKKVAEFKPHMILLDVLLSGNDGRDICKQLKNNPTTHNIPIVMISAHPTAKLSIKEYGANAFLAKPFEAAQLLAIVANYTK